MNRNFIYLFVIIASSVLIFIYLVTRYSIGSGFSRSRAVIITSNLNEHAFEVETVKTILYAHGSNIKKTMIENHPFNSMSREEQHRLCAAALKRLALKNVDIDVEVHKFRIVHLNEIQREDHVGMRCSTIPFIFLFTPQDPRNVIKIVVEKNQFVDERRELAVEIIKSAAFLHAVDLNAEQELHEDQLFDGRQRWEMCVAAKSRISGITTQSSHDWSDTIGIYNVVHATGEETRDVVAFPCNTSPKIYLRKGQSDSRGKLSVMLEEN